MANEKERTIECKSCDSDGVMRTSQRYSFGNGFSTHQRSQEAIKKNPCPYCNGTKSYIEVYDEKNKEWRYDRPSAKSNTL